MPLMLNWQLCFPEYNKIASLNGNIKVIMQVNDCNKRAEQKFFRSLSDRIRLQLEFLMHLNTALCADNAMERYQRSSLQFHLK